MVRMSATTSVTGSTLVPSLRYQDAPAAIDWLCRVFGFRRHAVYENPDGTIAHAELTLGKGMLMLGSAKNTGPHAHLLAQPSELDGRQTGGVYLVVEDCDSSYAAVQDAGGKIIQDLHQPDYGGKAFSCLDPEGYLWSVGSYDPWAYRG